jgi:hypothetical protein
MVVEHHLLTDICPITRDNLITMPPAESAPVRLMNTIWADIGGIHDDLATGRTSTAG